ncbi:MAG TPA: hypothetical protein VGD40_02700 [Chryseosolibacter sp.]
MEDYEPSLNQKTSAFKVDSLPDRIESDPLMQFVFALVDENAALKEKIKILEERISVLSGTKDPEA